MFQARELVSPRLGRFLTALTGALLVCLLYGSELAHAGTPLGWGTPEPVSAQTGLFGTFPLIIADSEGRVHALWSGGGTDERTGDAIYYAVWNGTWSGASDVLVSPDGGPAMFPEGVLDSNGMLHLLWLGGPGENSVYYSQALIHHAASPLTWSEPRTFLSLASNPGSRPCSMAIDSQKGLNTVCINVAGGTWSLEYSGSRDLGHTWSRTSVITTFPADEMPANPKIVSGEGKTLYVVWDNRPIPDAYPPVGVFFAQSADGGQTWQAPVELGRGEYAWANIAVTNQGSVHVVWLGSVTDGGRYHRLSEDGGQSWGPTEEIARMSGLTGWPGMWSDDAGVLHVVVSGNGYEHLDGLFYLRQDSAGWSVPEEVDTSLVRTHHPILAASLGHELHVLWTRLDTTLGHEIWHSSLTLDVRPEPTRLVPTPLPTETFSVPSTPLPSDTVDVIPSAPPFSAPLLPLDELGLNSRSEGLPTMVGVGAALALILVVLLSRLIRRD